MVMVKVRAGVQLKKSPPGNLLHFLYLLKKNCFGGSGHISQVDHLRRRRKCLVFQGQQRYPVAGRAGGKHAGGIRGLWALQGNDVDGGHP